MAPWSITEIARFVSAGERSAREVVRGALERLGAVQSATNALTQLLEGHALARADAIDRARAGGEALGPLAGVPVVVKDNICTTAGRTTCASRMLEGYESPFSATAVVRLESAGAVVVGKANLDEFAMGSSGELSAFGPTRNPWDLSRVPGGSSSGSAAAVAGGGVGLALGSDTGGSVRQPAAFTGLVGLRPTYGRVSRLGLVAHASSLDQVGTLTATAEEAAAALAVLAGRDPGDATSSPVPVGSYAQEAGASVAGVRVAAMAPPASAGVHRDVLAGYERALAALRDAGVVVEPAAMPDVDVGIAAYYLIAMAEASSNLARYDGVRYGRRASLAGGEGLEELYVRSRTEGLGPEVRRRILLGTHVLRSGYADRYYDRALRARRLVGEQYRALFAGGVSACVLPTTPGPAFGLGEKGADPLAMYLEDVFTVAPALAGLPAVSVPAGLSDAGGVRLPVGVQLVGRAFEEGSLLSLARAVERGVGPIGPSPLAADVLAGGSGAGA